MTVENPFVVYSPEDLNPKEFKEIFVKEYTWINALETTKDYFIYGVRGSGKSMLLNYLEFAHQLYYFKNNLKSFLEKERKQKYIGIMVHATLDKLNTERYELLVKNKFDEEGLIKNLCMSDLVMLILYRIITTLIETKGMAKYVNSLDNSKFLEFCKEVMNEFDQRHIHKSNFNQHKTNSDLLKTLAKIFQAERTMIEYYANDKLQIKDTIYKGNYSDFNIMHFFITKIKTLLNIKDFSFYILIDNGDETKKIMQLCIDSLISQRKHREICFKVAIKKGSRWNKGNIQSPHDYSQIDIDELYSTQHTVYYDRIKEIANKRLEIAGFGVNISEFLPESPIEKTLLKKIKTELTKKYEKEYDKYYPQPSKTDIPSKTDFVNNRVSKYAQAELFRRLKKTPKSYAGFDNIVDLSSGIIRQFLDICSYMFDEETKKQLVEKINKISLETQNAVIKKYADDFIDQLQNKYKRLRMEGDLETASLYQSLFYLIESLGAYYKELLMNPKLKEPRVFTFTLKDLEEDPEIERILELGVNDNYFQTYWYSSKIGRGKYRGYAYNRRLCPRYVIDHTSFRGRIELSTDELKSAIKNKRFPKSSYYQKEKYATLDLFDRGEE